VRSVVPSSGSTAPLGWTCLPVFERSTSNVASGYYQLPLFQGVPSRSLLQVGAGRSVICEPLHKQDIRLPVCMLQSLYC
jgi:hypothetical protein